MAGGLPGVGLGGLFFVAAALLMPLVEIVRTVRGNGSRDRWPWILRNFLIALAIVGVVWGTYLAIDAVFSSPSGTSTAAAPSASPVGTFSLTTLVIFMSLVLLTPVAQLGVARLRGSTPSGAGSE